MTRDRDALDRDPGRVEADTRPAVLGIVRKLSCRQRETYSQTLTLERRPGYPSFTDSWSEADSLRLDLFDYHLPADRIAQEPRPRGSSRLLVLDRRREPIRTARSPTFLRSSPPETSSSATTCASATPVSTGAMKAAASSSSFSSRRSTRPARWSALAKPGRRAKKGRGSPVPGGARRPRSRTSGADGRRGGALRSRRRRRAPRADRARSARRPTSGGRRARRTDRKIERPTRPSSRASRSRSRRPRPASTSPTEIRRADPRTRRRRRRPDARRRRRDLQAGHGATKSRSHGMDAESVTIPAAPLEAIAAARAGRPRRGGRNDGRPVARSGGAPARPRRAGDRRFFDGPLHHPGIRVPRDRRAPDELPPSALDPPDARLRLRGARERSRAPTTRPIREGYLFYSFGDAMFIA